MGRDRLEGWREGRVEVGMKEEICMYRWIEEGMGGIKGWIEGEIKGGWKER